MLDFADARPDSARDRQLRLTMDAQLLRSFIYLLEQAESSLKNRYPKTRAELHDLLASIETDGVRLRGTAYAIHTQLVEAMRKGRAQNVDELLRHLPTVRWLGMKPKVLPLWSPEFTPLESQAFFSTVASDYESTYARPFDATSPSEAEAGAMKQIIESTLQKIAELDTETSGEIDGLISDFITVRSDLTNAGTCVKAFGLVYLTVLREEQEWTTYLESIVHEEAHHHLFALWTLDPLLVGGEELYRSPIRSEPRPMSGVFHAMFVLARTIRCLNIFRAYPKFTAEVNRLPTSYNQANNPAPLEEQFMDAYATVRDNARLTAFGAKVLESSRLMALGC